jgi:hypothetical protein
MMGDGGRNVALEGNARITLDEGATHTSLNS